MMIDNRLFTEVGKESIANDVENLPDNVATTVEEVAKIPVIGPIWMSEFIDVHNDDLDEKTLEIKDNGYNGVPNLRMNIGGIEGDPSVGIGTQGCKANALCKLTDYLSGMEFIGKSQESEFIKQQKSVIAILVFSKETPIDDLDVIKNKEMIDINLSLKSKGMAIYSLNCPTSIYDKNKLDILK
jgi:hypothetical protein